jgi:hypothetical protein
MSNNTYKLYLRHLWHSSARNLGISEHPKWRIFRIVLKHPKSGKLNEVVKEETKKLSGADIQGIYMFFLEKECLYIGKSKNVGGRVYHHCKTAWGLTGSSRWRNFFKKYKNKNIIIKIYEVGFDRNESISEILRVIFEKYKAAIYNPKFEDEIKVDSKVNRINRNNRIRE